MVINDYHIAGTGIGNTISIGVGRSSEVNRFAAEYVSDGELQLSNSAAGAGSAGNSDYAAPEFQSTLGFFKSGINCFLAFLRGE